MKKKKRERKRGRLDRAAAGAPRFKLVQRARFVMSSSGLNGSAFNGRRAGQDGKVGRAGWGFFFFLPTNTVWVTGAMRLAATLDQ